MENPETGDVVPAAGGVRKMRFTDPRRGKGKRGGLRIIYFWWQAGSEFWLFTLYDKDETTDLPSDERKSIGKRIKAELSARS
ncbi:Toxin HigB-2 [compost metagenome]